MKKSAALAVSTLSALSALLFAGCAAFVGPTSSTTPSEPFMVVDPEDARLVAASSAISTRVGHSVSYDIDSALTVEHAQRMSELTSSALETVALAIDRARTESPEDAARACLIFSKLQLTRDERIREPSAWFERDTGTLVLHVPTQATSFADPDRVTEALLSLSDP